MIFKQTITADWITEPKTDTQYAVEETKEKIAIKLQGSTSKTDWIQNFSFWVKPYKEMENLFFVHYGFFKKFKSVKKIIYQKGLDASNGAKKLVILGYSQGAAIGLITAEYLRFHFPDLEIEAHLFEPPRVFTFIGSKVLKERLKGVKIYLNGNDIVTKVPPWIFAYKHYGEKVLIGKKRRWWKISIKEHRINSVRRALDDFFKGT